MKSRRPVNSDVMFLLAYNDNSRRQARVNRWGQIRGVGKGQYVVTRSVVWGGAGIVGDLLINFALGCGFRWFGILAFAVIAPITALVSWWVREAEYGDAQLDARTNGLSKR